MTGAVAASARSVPGGCGKWARDENFPVASLLIARRLRPTVMAFYAVARITDDIADDPALDAEEKLRRLRRFREALEGRIELSDVATATEARQAMAAAGVPVAHALRLLDAFERDAVKRRYDDWHDLLGYCADSAHPVGRFLLDLHGEDPAVYPASDALCTALQILNHLQDCRNDYRRLDRVYLPADWLASEGVPVEGLDAPRAAPGLRRVLDRCLDGVDDLLAEARVLPQCVRSIRLALEAAVVLRLAEVLARALRTQDPLAGPVRLSKSAMLRHGAAGAAGCLFRRALARTGPRA